MYCKVCGENCPDNAEFCTKCGQKLEKEVAYEAPVVETPVNQEAVSDEVPGKGLGIAALILSIVSLASCGSTPLAVAGLIMGIISNKKAKKKTASTAITLSIISLCLGVVAIIFIIFYYAFLFTMLGY